MYHNNTVTGVTTEAISWDMGFRHIMIIICLTSAQTYTTCWISVSPLGHLESSIHTHERIKRHETNFLYKKRLETILYYGTVIFTNNQVPRIPINSDISQKRDFLAIQAKECWLFKRQWSNKQEVPIHTRE